MIFYINRIQYRVPYEYPPSSDLDFFMQTNSTLFLKIVKSKRFSMLKSKD